MVKKYRPIIKEGTHLASSKTNNGKYRGSLLDDETNEVVGQAEWEEIGEDEYYSENYSEEQNSHYEDGLSEEMKELSEILGTIIGTALFELGSIGVSKASPYIKRFVKETVTPNINSASSWITKKSVEGKEIIIREGSSKLKFIQTLIKKSNKKDESSELYSSSDQSIVIVDEQNIKFEDYKEAISREEAMNRINKIQGLAVLLADEIKKFSYAYINNSNDSIEKKLEHQKKIEKLTTQEIMSSIKLLLDNQDSFILDKYTSKVLSDFFAGNITVDEQLIPLKTLMIDNQSNTDE